MNFKEKVLLKDYTSFRVGGYADYFIEVFTEEELIQSIKQAKEMKIPFFVLGGGSNILFSDSGYRGLVVKNKIKGIQLREKNIVDAGAGLKLAEIVSFCRDKGLSGLEWSAGIPATLGGAIIGNAGAFGSAMQDSIFSVKAYNVEKSEIQEFSKEESQFNYRDSFFKRNGEYLVLGAQLIFAEKEKKLIEKRIIDCLSQRKAKQPRNFSAGSVFKNYKIKDDQEKEDMLKRFPEIKESIEKSFVPAAFLIDNCGLKGKKINDAQISKIHANFIINLGQAKADDVKELMKIIKREVQQKFQIDLEEEIIVINT